MAKKKVSFEELLGFKKMQEISLERLHPPMVYVDHDGDASKEVILSLVDDPKPIASDKSGSGLISLSNSSKEVIPDSKLGIDYETIAKSSEFQRFIYFLLTGKTHRGKQVDLRNEVKAKITKFRGSGMGDVINEFKAKVARLREK